MRKQIDITIHETQDSGPDVTTRVTATRDKCSATRGAGRGIDWMIEWYRPDPMPRPANMTAGQRDVVSEALVVGIQLLDGPRGGFTPRTEVSIVGEARFDGAKEGS